MRRLPVLALSNVVALLLCTDPAVAQVARTGGSITSSCASGISRCDANWSVRWFSLFNPTMGGALARAAIVDNVSIPSPPWAPNIPGTQQWIGAANSASVGGNTRYYFQTTFTSSVSGVVNFGIGWDNRLVGAYVGGNIDNLTGLFMGGTSLIPGVSPSAPYTSNGKTAGFCRDGDGVFPGAQYPNCVFNLALGINANAANTLTFVIEGDGTTDGFLLGGASGANPPIFTPAPPTPPTVVPEPSTVVLLAGSLFALGMFQRRRMRSA